MQGKSRAYQAPSPLARRLRRVDRSNRGQSLTLLPNLSLDVLAPTTANRDAPRKLWILDAAMLMVVLRPRCCCLVEGTMKQPRAVAVVAAVASSTCSSGSRRCGRRTPSFPKR
jgi:hypothetical protein